MKLVANSTLLVTLCAFLLLRTFAATIKSIEWYDSLRKFEGIYGSSAYHDFSVFSVQGVFTATFSVGNLEDANKYFQNIKGESSIWCLNKLNEDSDKLATFFKGFVEENLAWEGFFFKETILGNEAIDMLASLIPLVKRVYFMDMNEDLSKVYATLNPSKLEYLTLSKVNLTAEAVDLICNFLENSQSLQYLYLDQLESSVIKRFLVALGKNMKIGYIFLKGFSIDNESMAAFTNELQKRTSKVHFDLYEMTIAPNELQLMADLKTRNGNISYVSADNMEDLKASKPSGVVMPEQNEPSDVVVVNQEDSSEDSSKNNENSHKGDEPNDTSNRNSSKESNEAGKKKNENAADNNNNMDENDQPKITDPKDYKANSKGMVLCFQSALVIFVSCLLMTQ